MTGEKLDGLGEQIALHILYDDIRGESGACGRCGRQLCQLLQRLFDKRLCLRRGGGHEAHRHIFRQRCGPGQLRRQFRHLRLRR